MKLELVGGFIICMPAFVRVMKKLLIFVCISYVGI